MSALVIDKEKIVKLLIGFPENVVVDEFIDKIIIAAKIEKALGQYENGEYMTSEELDDEIQKWDSK